LDDFTKFEILGDHHGLKNGFVVLMVKAFYGQIHYVKYYA